MLKRFPSHQGGDSFGQAASSEGSRQNELAHAVDFTAALLKPVNARTRKIAATRLTRINAQDSNQSLLERFRPLPETAIPCWLFALLAMNLDLSGLALDEVNKSD
jgi:C4-dicarboxylate-specific signal transduction histidine kinase